MIQQYGTTHPMRFWLGNHAIIAVFNPKDVEVSKNDNYTHSNQLH